MFPHPTATLLPRPQLPRVDDLSQSFHRRRAYPGRGSRDWSKPRPASPKYQCRPSASAAAMDEAKLFHSVV
jgi:hypothetical protein